MRDPQGHCLRPGDSIPIGERHGWAAFLFNQVPSAVSDRVTNTVMCPEAQRTDMLLSIWKSRPRRNTHTDPCLDSGFCPGTAVPGQRGAGLPTGEGGFPNVGLDT